MNDRALVLVLSNDSNRLSAQLSRQFCLALNRLGTRSIARDTRLVRWGAATASEESAERRDAFETVVVAKWERLVSDYGVDTVVSLDLDWLISPRLFLPSENIKEIHSFWLQDQIPDSLATTAFASVPNPSEQLNHLKVVHHCDENQAEKLRQLGVQRLLLDLPSADAPEVRAVAWEDCFRKNFS